MKDCTRMACPSWSQPAHSSWSQLSHSSWSQPICSSWNLANRFSWRKVILLSALLASAHAQADARLIAIDSNHLAIGEDSIRSHRLDSVEVKAVRIAENVKSVMPVQVLSKERIDLLGSQTLGDAIKQFAGVTVRDYGGIGGMQTVSVRSLGACHTAVSYDGVVVSNMQAGQIDVSRFSLENVAQLAVAIGQNSDQMQSARHYASAGMLSIETERPSFLQPNGLGSSRTEAAKQKDWMLRAKVKSGSWGLASPSIKYGHRIGTSTAITLDANMVRADGVYPFTLVNGREKTREKRYNSDVLSAQGELNVYHTFSSSSHTLDTKVAYSTSKRGLPGVVILYNPETKERMWDENFFVQSVFKAHLSEKWQLQARLKYAHSWTKYEDYNSKYEGGKRTDVDRQNEYYASATVGYDILRNMRIALAEDFSIGNLRNNIEAQPNPTRYTNQAALSLRWKPSRWLFDANVVGTYITERAARTDKHSTASGSSASSTGVAARIPADRHRLSPSVALSYRLLPQEMLYLRAMMKSTYRVPTFTDMYYLHIGNTNLKPENATEWNLGATWNHTFGHGMNLRRGMGFARGINMQATVDVYYNKVTDKIVAFPSTYVWHMVNFGKVDITGVDATLLLSLPLPRRMEIDMQGAYTYQKSVDKTNPEKSYYGKQLPYTPRHSGSMSLIWKNPWVNLGWQMMASSKRYSMIQGTAEYKLQAYTEHSFTLSKDIARLHLSASLLNAFNKQYEVIQYYPMPGRSFQVAAMLEL